MSIHKQQFLVWIFSLFFIGLNTAVGQPDTQGRSVLSGFGIKGGLAVSGYDGEDYRPYLGYEVGWIQGDEGDPDVGFQIGVFYTRPLSKHWALQPELHFARRGLHFYKTELYNTSYSLKAYYLQVPVLLKYRAFLMGPYAAVKLGATRTVDAWGERDTKSLSCVKRLDYGWVFAFSPSFAAWSGRWIAEIRVDLGLAEAMAQPEAHSALFEEPNPVRILAFTVMTGFRF